MGANGHHPLVDFRTSLIDAYLARAACRPHTSPGRVLTVRNSNESAAPVAASTNNPIR